MDDWVGNLDMLRSILFVILNASVSTGGCANEACLPARQGSPMELLGLILHLPQSWHLRLKLTAHIIIKVQ